MQLPSTMTLTTLWADLRSGLQNDLVSQMLYLSIFAREKKEHAETHTACCDLLAEGHVTCVWAIQVRLSHPYCACKQPTATSKQLHSLSDISCSGSGAGIPVMTKNCKIWVTSPAIEHAAGQ
jgi:hypothetical protein